MNAFSVRHVEGGQQLIAFYTPCCPDQVHYDCKRCGDLFCPRHQGGADDLEPSACGFEGHEVCDSCWCDLTAEGA